MYTDQQEELIIRHLDRPIPQRLLPAATAWEAVRQAEAGGYRVRLALVERGPDGLPLPYRGVWFSTNHPRTLYRTPVR